MKRSLANVPVTDCNSGRREIIQFPALLYEECDHNEDHREKLGNLISWCLAHVDELAQTDTAKNQLWYL